MRNRKSASETFLFWVTPHQLDLENFCFFTKIIYVVSLRKSLMVTPPVNFKRWTEVQSHWSNLALESWSFSTSSSIWANTAFFSSFPAIKNSFTRLSKLATIPAYIKKNKVDQEHIYVMWWSTDECTYLTNFGRKLSFPITTGATFLINEIYKVIYVPATVIIFTSFVALWEKL